MRFYSHRYGRSTRWYLFGTLAVVELLMSFSFLGYLHVEPISITFAYLPVLLAGALLGVPEAAALGAVFGLASMWKAGAGYVAAFDQLFSPFRSGHPWESLLLSVGTRVLFGFLMGLLYAAARRLPHPGVWVCLFSFFGSTLHSFLVYSALWAFFPETGFRPVNALLSLARPNTLAANFVVAALVCLFWRLEKSHTWRDFLTRVEKARKLQQSERRHRIFPVLIILFTFCLAMAVALYFVNRMNQMLKQSGIVLSEGVYSDLLHLQLQFLIGILSLTSLVIIFLIFNRRYTAYMNHKAKTDALTGLLTRQAFFHACSGMLSGFRPRAGEYGYFIMLDVDYFKRINDQYGHPEGDRCLEGAARELRKVFEQEGVLGRLGGDEFAVLLYLPIPRERLEEKLRRLQEGLRHIETEGGLSCSIGALPVAEEQSAEELYQSADRLLYQAKEQGRGRYVVGEPEGAGSPGGAS